MHDKSAELSAKRAGNLFFLLVVVQIAGALVYGIAGFFLPGLYEFAASTVYSQALMLVPTLLAAACSHLDRRKVFPLRRIRPVQIVLALLMTVAAFPLGSLLNTLSSLPAGNTAEQMSGEIVRSPMWEMVLLIGLAGPFCEELVFRGYLFQNLKRGNRMVPAAVLSGLLFGLLHLNFNQFVYAAGLGILFALAAEAGGSLWISILMHQAFNTAEVWMMYLPGNNARSAGGAADPAVTGTLAGTDVVRALTVSPADLLLSAFLAAAGLAVFFLLLKQMRKNAYPETEKENPRVREKTAKVQKKTAERVSAEEDVRPEEQEENGEKRHFSGPGIAGVLIAAAYMIATSLLL